MEASGDSYGRRALAIATLGAFLAFLDTTIVNIAFPDLHRSFPEASVRDLSWVLSAYNIVFAAFLVPAGRLADVLGRRRLFLAGLGVFTAASLLCAIAPSEAVLILARVIQALGAATLVPASLGLFLPSFPLTRRATVVGVWAAGAAIAGGIGPSLGGVLVEAASWRWVFLVNLPIGLLVLAAGRRRLLETRDPLGHLPDFAAAALLACTIGSLALGIVKGEDWGWSSPSILGAFAGSMILAAAFYLRTRAAETSAFAFELFRVRSFALANAATLAFAMAIIGVVLANVLFLTSVWHYTVLEAGLATTPTPLITGIVAAPAGRLADRIGHRALIASGTLIYALGLTYYIVAVGAEPAFLAAWLPGAVIAGIGIGLAFPVLSSAALASVPADRLATASAINATARQLGAVLGVAVVVAIVGSSALGATPSTFDRAWAFAACLALVSASVSTRLDLRAQSPASSSLKRATSSSAAE